MKRIGIVLAMCIGLAASSAHGATFTVTNLDDAGPGSLRQAVIDANAFADVSEAARIIVCRYGDLNGCECQQGMRGE